MVRRGLMEENLAGRIIQHNLGKLVPEKVMTGEKIIKERTINNAKCPKLNKYDSENNTIGFGNQKYICGQRGRFHHSAKGSSQTGSTEVTLMRLGSKDEGEDRAAV